MKIAAHAKQNVETTELYLTAVAQSMAANHVRLYGQFAVGGDDLDEPALASITLAMPPARRSVDPEVATIESHRNTVAALLVKKHRDRRPEADVNVVELGIGSAMAATSAGEYRMPPEVTGQDQVVVRPQFKAEFQIPAPEGVKIIVLAVTTDNEAGWPTVAAAAMRIANSIRFEASVDEAGS
ncbi:MAG: hypothetical protein ACRDQ7_25765 [Haloechinothrix sp.]